MSVFFRVSSRLSEIITIVMSSPRVPRPPSLGTDLVREGGRRGRPRSSYSGPDLVKEDKVDFVYPYLLVPTGTKDEENNGEVTIVKELP